MPLGLIIIQEVVMVHCEALAHPVRVRIDVPHPPAVRHIVVFEIERNHAIVNRNSEKLNLPNLLFSKDVLWIKHILLWLIDALNRVLIIRPAYLTIPKRL